MKEPKVGTLNRTLEPVRSLERSRARKAKNIDVMSQNVEKSGCQIPANHLLSGR